MTCDHLQADCLYTGISSGPSARCRVWEAFTYTFVRDSHVRQLAEDRSDSGRTHGAALTQFIVGNAVSLAERCVAHTARFAASSACAAKRGRRPSKTSDSVLDRFFRQVRCDDSVDAVVLYCADS